MDKKPFVDLLAEASKISCKIHSAWSGTTVDGEKRFTPSMTELDMVKFDRALDDAIAEMDKDEFDA